LRTSREKSRKAYRAYEVELAKWKRDPAVRDARRWLDAAIHSLRDRGLLQHEGATARYDMHPVVRSVVADDLTGPAQEAAGQRVVDHFTVAPHAPYDEAETLADLTVGLELMRALTRLGRFEEAMSVYMEGLSSALYFNLDARDEMHALLSPFFPEGWEGEPVELPASMNRLLVHQAALAVNDAGTVQSLLIRALRISLAKEDVSNATGGVMELAIDALSKKRLAEAERFLVAASRLSEDEDDRKAVRLYEFILATEIQRPDVLSLGESVVAFEWGQDFSRFTKSTALVWYAEALRQEGQLTDAKIVEAGHWAEKFKDRSIRESVHLLWARHKLGSEGASAALPYFEEALAMTRERGEIRHTLEAQYLRTRHLAGYRVTPEDAARLDDALDEDAVALAELWETLGNSEVAATWALRAHTHAAADGEPYVWRSALERTRALLTRLGRPLPKVPDYDPAFHRPYDWEAEVEAFIDRLETRRTDEEALRQAVRDRDIDCIRLLSRKGVSMLARGEDGQDADDLVRALEREEEPLASTLRAALMDRPDDAPA